MSASVWKGRAPANNRGATSLRPLSAKPPGMGSTPARRFSTTSTSPPSASARPTMSNGSTSFCAPTAIPSLMIYLTFSNASLGRGGSPRHPRQSPLQSLAGTARSSRSGQHTRPVHLCRGRDARRRADPCLHSATRSVHPRLATADIADLVDPVGACGTTGVHPASPRRGIVAARSGAWIADDRRQ